MAWKHLEGAENQLPLEFRLAPEATLRGTVRDEHGKPIAGAAVTLASIGCRREEDNGGFPIPQLMLRRSRIAFEAKTDAAGRFAIPGIPRGEPAALVVEHRDFALATLYAAAGDAPQADIAELYWVDDRIYPTSTKVHAGDVAITLKPGRSVTGDALFEDTGRPAAGLLVLVKKSPQEEFRAWTDDEGRFGIHSLPEGDLQLSVPPPEGMDYLGWQSAVQFQQNQASVHLQVRLPKGHVVTGKVVDEETGVGVPKAPIIYDSGVAHAIVYEAATDAEGRFRLAVPAGKGTVRVSGFLPGYDLPVRYTKSTKLDAAPFERCSRDVDLGRDHPSVSLLFPISRGLVMRGAVTDEGGRPVEGADVLRVSGREGSDEEFLGRTAADGRFSASGFHVGSEHILVATDARRKLRGAIRVSPPPTTERKQVVDVAISLLPTGTVKGKLLFRGKPVEHGYVELHFSGEPIKVPYVNLLHGVRLGKHRWTDSDGAFEFDMVPARTGFNLRINVKDAEDPFSSPEFILEPGQVLTLPPLEPAPKPDRTVSGIVVDPDGKPIAGVTIEASDPTTRTGIPHEWTLTGEDGRFAMTRLPDTALSLTAYLAEAESYLGRAIRVPARVDVGAGDADVRIVFDTRLLRGPPDMRGVKTNRGSGTIGDSFRPSRQLNQRGER